MLTARASLSIYRRERYKKREYYYSTILYEETLWRKQNIPVKIWNQDDFRIYLWSKFGIKLENSSTGNGIISNTLTAGTGLNYVGQNNGTNTFTVDKFGTTTATSFIKSSSK